VSFADGLSWVRELLDTGELVEVLGSDDPVYGWYLVLDHEVARECDEWVDDFVDALSGAPSVTGAIREDAGVVLVSGEIEAEELASWLDAWWRVRLSA
jgi:hypothetical protein